MTFDLPDDVAESLAVFEFSITGPFRGGFFYIPNNGTDGWLQWNVDGQLRLNNQFYPCDFCSPNLVPNDDGTVFGQFGGTIRAPMMIVDGSRIEVNAYLSSQCRANDGVCFYDLMHTGALAIRLE